MRTLLTFLCGLLVLTSVSSCKQPVTPVATDTDPVANTSFFNQDKTQFRGAQVNRMLEVWYRGRSRQTIDFAVINDPQMYRAFCNQTSVDSLPAIDFSQYSLIIGLRGAYGLGTFNDGPANIRSIEQKLERQSNGEWQHTVTIRARSKGQEWFGFSALVPRITQPEAVKLVMDYRYE